MKVLVIGSGAREHALCRSLSLDPAVTALHCAPGNAGIAEIAELHQADILDGAAVLALATRLEADLVVVGTGVAGLTAALRARELGLNVLVVTKDAADGGNTRWAQGGVAVVLGDVDADSVARHVDDTLVAGVGLCDPVATARIIGAGPAAAVLPALSWGAGAAANAMVRGQGNALRAMVGQDDAQRAAVAAVLDQPNALAGFATAPTSMGVLDYARGQ